MKTDTQLQQDVMAELAWEPAVHAAEIGVQVKDGVVTLSGQVSSYQEKEYAELAALRVNGVQALAVEMEVKLGALGKRNDADIARSVETALDWMGAPMRTDVKVAVESGWLTLSGLVEWQFSVRPLRTPCVIWWALRESAIRLVSVRGLPRHQCSRRLKPHWPGAPRSMPPIYRSQCEATQ